MGKRGSAAENDQLTDYDLCTPNITERIHALSLTSSGTEIAAVQIAAVPRRQSALISVTQRSFQTSQKGTLPAQHFMEFSTSERPFNLQFDVASAKLAWDAFRQKGKI